MNENLYAEASRLLEGAIIEGKGPYLSALADYMAAHIDVCPKCGLAWALARLQGTIPFKSDLCAEGRRVARAIGRAVE